MDIRCPLAQDVAEGRGRVVTLSAGASALAREFLAAAKAAQAGAALGAGLTLERLVSDPDLGAFNASSAQLAIVRAADGVPLGGVLPPDRMLFHFGAERLPSGRPRLVVLRTGVRAGKSLLAALGLLLSILTCSFRRPPLPHEVPGADGLVGVRPGERVRAPIVAPRLELARTVYAHLVGTMMASPRLRALLPERPGVEATTVRRPSDGALVEVVCLAASSGGTNLRSTWLAGVVFDEADFFDEEDAAVNLSEQIDASAPRLLAGGQAWVVSSPWAEEGPYHDLFTRAFGRGDADVLAFHSDTRSMNPTLDEGVERAERARDPDKAAREYDARPLSTNGAAFFPEAILSLAVDDDRPMHLEPAPGYAHVAGTDLGFRKNSSALAIARGEDGRAVLAFHDEKRPAPGAPLVPSEVCSEFAATCKGYGVESVRGDLHYAETAREHFGKAGIVYDDWNPSQDAQAEAFSTVRSRMAEGRVRLPNDPRLLAQFRGVRSQPVPGGRVRIILPKQGQAHGDVLMAAVLALSQVELDEPDATIFRVYSRRR